MLDSIRLAHRVVQERMAMITWKQSRFQLRVGLLVGTCVVTGCAGSKDSTPSSFDMSEYRQMMERQKGSEGSLEDPTPSVPEMTADEHERAGDMDAQRRNFPLAGVHYSKALNTDPTRHTVRLKLGQIFLQQGMFEPALTQFQNLRAREPNSAPAHQGIGHVYLLQGKLREAEEALTKAVALDPSSWLSHNLLGLAYDQGQRHAEAITAYKTALALRPREPGVLNNLGLAYALSGDHEAAIQAYEQAVAAGSAPPKLYNNLASGDHLFRVRSRDVFGNVDPTPAYVSWTVDSAPPAAEIIPPTTVLSNKITASTTATVYFISNQRDSSFECKSDNGPFKKCSSPLVLIGLNDGSHALSKKIARRGSEWVV